MGMNDVLKVLKFENYHIITSEHNWPHIALHNCGFHVFNLFID